MPFGQGQICGWTVPGAAEAAFNALFIWQGMALLEIVHAVVGVVKTGVLTSVLQVFSRVIYVYCLAYVVPDVILPLGIFWTLCFAWSLTEVVRYSWYAIKELTGAAPFPLTWCRYSFFYVLYPLGVYSENMAQWTGAHAYEGSERGMIAFKYAMYFVLAQYPPFFPMLYMHMIKQRKKQLYPKPKAKPKPERGVCFPKDGPEDTIKTSITGAKIISAALKGAGRLDLAADADKAGKKWRFGYLKHYIKMMYASAESPETTVKIAESGLEYMHQNFRFVDETGKDESFADHMAGIKKSGATPFEIGVIEGKKTAPPTSWKVPYNVYPATSGKTIEGTELEAQCDAWASYGTIERDTAEAIKAVVSSGDKWMDLRGHTFVLIGAGSAMGPFPKLMELGATVVALDIPGAWGFRAGKPGYRGPWSRLIEMAKNSNGGKLIFPLGKPQKDCADDEELYRNCGSNLTEQPGEILNWLLKAGVCGDGPVTVGNYTYLDSDMHVKLSLCADAIIAGLIEKKKQDVKVAFLCTPTDLHVIHKETWEDAKANGSLVRFKYPFEFFFSKIAKQLKSNVMKPAGSGKDIYFVNGISVAQGPNYALAKRLQHWRAMLAYNAGCTVSTNIAPSTATASVVSNITFKWAYGGMPFFKPYEIFWQETTNAVMAAMLVHDVRNPNAAANPANRKKYEINNLLELFKYGSFHGGVWRAAYTVDSLGVPSVLCNFIGGPTLAVFVAYAFSLGCGYYFTSPAFLGGAFVSDMKILFSM